MLPGMSNNVWFLPVERSLATLDVTRLAGERTFRRGLQYVGDGRVLVSGRSGGVLTASVSGGDTYEVRVGFGPAGLEHSCTCPMGVDGAFCKHLVAAVVEVTSIDDWATSLHRLIDTAEALLADGGSADVLTFCERAAAHLEAHANDASDRARVQLLRGRLDDLRKRAHRRAR
jgi:SWIM zinc finger